MPTASGSRGSSARSGSAWRSHSPAGKPEVRGGDPLVEPEAAQGALGGGALGWRGRRCRCRRAGSWSECLLDFVADLADDWGLDRAHVLHEVGLI